MTNYKIYYSSYEEVDNLAVNILKEIKKNNIKIDTLVPILRGGMPLSLILSNNLENVDTAAIHIRRSITNESNSDFEDAKMLGITNVDSIKGKNILLVEDIVDKGDTLNKAIKELEKYNPSSIKIATLYNFNKKLNIISGKIFDSYVWVVFPWEKKLIKHD